LFLPDIKVNQITGRIMNISKKTLHEELRNEFASLLRLPIDKLPAQVSPILAGEFLNLKPRTLAIWRCTKRYDLPFYKAGRMVNYRLADLIRYKASRVVGY